MNYVWNKVRAFLNELRCEETSRTTLVHLESCIQEQSILRYEVKQYQRVLEKMEGVDASRIVNYVEQIKTVAFEEQQEAYCQGIIDCILIIMGMGLIAYDERIFSLVNELRK